MFDPATTRINRPLRGAPDVIVIGSGAGGGPMTWSLAQQGYHVLLLERGEAVPREPDNSSVEEVFLKLKYSPTSAGTTAAGRRTGRSPGTIPAARPSSSARSWCATAKATSARCSMSKASRPPGRSAMPTWSHGTGRPSGSSVSTGTLARPSRPAAQLDPAYGPVGNEPFVQRITEKVRALGLHPFPLPVAVDLHPGGKCQRCSTCDGFPCPFGGKNDAETRCVEPALATGNVTMWTGALVRRLVLDETTRRINAVEVDHRGESGRSPRTSSCCRPGRSTRR